MAGPIDTTRSEPSPPADAGQDSNSDVWADSDDEQISGRPPHAPGDIPKLRREHYNAGYLEGISSSKDGFLQQGFDSGYPSGASIGLQVGEILGILQGLGLHDVERIAKNELSPAELFCKKYYDEKDELAKPKFDVSVGHPEVVRWQEHVKTLFEK